MASVRQPAAAVTLEQLETDPHPVHAALRETEPVAWVPPLDGWLVTRRDLALAAMRDARTFTVEDERFTTQRVVGPSMLSTDGAAHARQRRPFTGPFRPAAVRARFAAAVETEADRLVDGFAADGEAELRRAFAGPLAVFAVDEALGLQGSDPVQVLAWYDGIVGSVSAVTAGAPETAAGRAGFAALEAALQPVLDGDPEASLLAAAAAQGILSRDEAVSNAAVMLFGGIETTEGMIANAVLHLLTHPGTEADLPAAVEESLRLEPAAASIDRYATRDVVLGAAEIGAGDLVTISVAAANRDPAEFDDPDAFRPGRPNVARHLAFARGPHVCVGMHLARLEAHAGIARLFARLPRLQLGAPAAPRGLVVRKPPELQVTWG